MASLAEQKKLLLPFLQRADEVQKAEPKIAYYCRLYAVQQAMEIPDRAPEITGLLGALLAKLEKDKASLAISKDDNLYVENFALTVFGRADRADRAGKSDKATAVTFYAASYFLEILNQFGELPPDLLAKQRYAAWRAAEINKAIKEGRPPVPPPVAKQGLSEEDQELMDSLGGAPSAGLAPAASGSYGAPLQGPSSSSQPGSPQRQPPSPYQQQAPFSGPAAGGGSGDYGTGGGDYGPVDEGLPSPPKKSQQQQQLGQELSPQGSAYVAPPPRSFQPFQKVLFFDEAAAAPQRGTVAKVEAPADTSSSPTYFVALKGTPKHPEEAWLYRIVHADVHHLAPELSKGDSVQYQGPSGESVRATIEQVDTSHWPPSYLICTEQGSYVETIDDRITPLLPEDLRPPEQELAELQLAAQQAEQQAQRQSAVAAPPVTVERVPDPPAQAATPSSPPAGSYPPPGAFTSSGSGPSAPPPGSPPVPAPHSSAAAAAAAGYPPAIGAGYPQPGYQQPPHAAVGPPTAPAARGAAYPHPPVAAPGHAGPRLGPSHAASPLAAAAAPRASATAAAANPAALPRPVPGYSPSLQTITEAQKLTKSAVSAMSFEDVPTAVKHLTQALLMLTQPEQAVQQGGRR